MSFSSSLRGLAPPLPILFWILLLVGSSRFALAQPSTPAPVQRYLTRFGLVTLFSATPLADIEARNANAGAVFDLTTGQVAATLLMKDFQFERQLMQQHFNESYLETDKYPKAVMVGKLVDYQPGSLQPGSKLTAIMEGELALHGVTKHLRAPVYLEYKDGRVVASTRFVIAPADYNIEIPLIVRDHIAKAIDVNVTFLLDPTTPSPTAVK